MLAELHWIKGKHRRAKSILRLSIEFSVSPSAARDRNTWYANLVALAMIAFLLPGLVWCVASFANRADNKELIAAATVTVTSFIFATAVSRPLWAVIPKLSECSFPGAGWLLPHCAVSVVVAASLFESG